MNWIKEDEAAKVIGRSPRRLRKHVKSGLWKIAYTAPNGRGYMYSKEDLEKMLDSFSTKTQEPQTA